MCFIWRQPLSWLNCTDFSNLFENYDFIKICFLMSRETNTLCEMSNEEDDHTSEMTRMTAECSHDSMGINLISEFGNGDLLQILSNTRYLVKKNWQFGWWVRSSSRFHLYHQKKNHCYRWRMIHINKRVIWPLSSQIWSFGNLHYVFNPDRLMKNGEVFCWSE